MKIKIVDSNFNEELNSFNITIATDLGNFNWTTVIREEDKEFCSTFFGYECAELKAIIKYFKQKKKNFDLELKGMRKFKNFLLHNEQYVYPLNKYEQEQLKRKKMYEEKIKELQDLYLQKITDRDMFIKKLKDKKAK